MEKLDGYTLMYLLKNITGISIEELIQHNNLNYSSPTTVNRYLNKEKHPNFPTSLTIEMVQRTFMNLLKVHFRDNAGGFANALFDLLKSDLECPTAAEELRALYEEKRREAGDLEACRIMIDDLYVKCKKGTVYNSSAFEGKPVAPLAKNRQSVSDSMALSDRSNIKATAEKRFISVVQSLKYIEKGSDASSISIKQDWLPCLIQGKEVFKNLSDYILSQIQSGCLVHYVFFSEPGTGKTYSIFSAMKDLLSKDISYDGKQVVPVFISALLLSINKTGISEYIEEVFFEGSRKTAMELFQGSRSPVHFVLFIDAINESLLYDELLDEIIGLSFPVNKNVSLFVSSNNANDTVTLQNSDFTEVKLSQLDVNIIDAEVKDDNLSPGLKALLRKPFYLKKYLSFKGTGGVNDEYSVIDAYINSCKTNGKIVRARDSKRWIQLLDEQFPRLCYQCAIQRQMYISLEECREDNYPFMTDEQNIRRLVQAGILKKYSNSVYFEHENYRNYFAAKYLYNKYTELYTNPDAPPELKNLLNAECTRLLESTPANVCAILAPKLYNESILDRLLKDYGPICHDRQFYKLIINLYSFATTVLDGLDLSDADCWITDFSKFDRITHCDFTQADLNPETLWIHHAKISYTSRNSGLLQDDLVFLSGPEGFEVYNWKNDRQLFIRFVEAGIPDSWGTTPDALIVCRKGAVYRVDFQEIRRKSHANTAPGEEEILLSGEYETDPASAGAGFTSPGRTKNGKGDEISYQSGKELYIKLNGKPTIQKLSDTCQYAAFIDDGKIFADCGGVYIIVTLDGILLWKRMIKPIIPFLHRKEEKSAIVRMEIPGIAQPKYFRYSFQTQKMAALGAEEAAAANEGSTSSPPETHPENLPGDIPSDTVVREKLIIKDSCGRIHEILGGAIEFTGTLFRETTIVSRPIDAAEECMLSQFGGLFSQ